jgi:hypothetical protein
VIDAEVADILVDDVGAVAAVRLHETALPDVVAVANLHQLVRMVDRQRDLSLIRRHNVVAIKILGFKEIGKVTFQFHLENIKKPKLVIKGLKIHSIVVKICFTAIFDLLLYEGRSKLGIFRNKSIKRLNRSGDDA